MVNLLYAWIDTAQKRTAVRLVWESQASSAYLLMSIDVWKQEQVPKLLTKGFNEWLVGLRPLD